MRDWLPIALRGGATETRAWTTWCSSTWSSRRGQRAGRSSAGVSWPGSRCTRRPVSDLEVREDAGSDFPLWRTTHLGG